MDLAQTMKSRRKTLGISQQDLAEIAEVSLATVKDIERGHGNPDTAQNSQTNICDIVSL